MIDLVVPKWGLTMEDAEVVDWLVEAGATVAEGDELLELETDKANGMVESPCSGTLAEVLVAVGDVVVPGQVVGRIDPT